LGADTRWISMCMEIESRSLPSAQLEVRNTKVLFNQLLKILEDADNKGILLTKRSSIRKLLQIDDQSNPNESEITGGARNFKRLKELPHFERRDGCWFDFAITLRKTDTAMETIGFNFEIRFPDGVPVRFLRFDLNLPSHDNEERGMRFHIHPGNDDFMINAPPMSPIEILHLFLYGFTIPEKQRSQ
jgi:hypothetical protein